MKNIRTSRLLRNGVVATSTLLQMLFKVLINNVI
ncbi:MAG: hypothetical protein FD155_1285 [Bacteroidetes bacterium]|nr:MAG: hypothetical protein FD155_1285 [Bacteroidota bacterium]